MADGGQAQQVQTFQVQTQQVHTDNKAVEAIDAAIKSMGIKEQVDAIGNAFFEHVGHLFGAALHKVAEKGASIGQHTMAKLDSPGLSGKPDPSPPAVARSQQIEVPEQTKAISREVADQVAGAKLNLPKDVAPPVHVEAAQVAEMAANTSKQTMMSNAMATQTQQTALG